MSIKQEKAEKTAGIFFLLSALVSLIYNIACLAYYYNEFSDVLSSFFGGTSWIWNLILILIYIFAAVISLRKTQNKLYTVIFIALTAVYSVYFIYFLILFAFNASMSVQEIIFNGMPYIFDMLAAVLMLLIVLGRKKAPNPFRKIRLLPFLALLACCVFTFVPYLFAILQGYVNSDMVIFLIFTATDLVGRLSVALAFLFTSTACTAKESQPPLNDTTVITAAENTSENNFDKT